MLAFCSLDLSGLGNDDYSDHIEFSVAVLIATWIVKVRIGTALHGELWSRIERAGPQVKECCNVRKLGIGGMRLSALRRKAAPSRSLSCRLVGLVGKLHARS